MEDYQLKRNKGQKNLRMHFKDDGTLIVSVPYFTSKEEIEKFISDNSTWIEKNKNSIPEHTYTNGDLIPYKGKNCVLITIKGKNSTDIIDNSIIVSVPYPENLKTVRKNLYTFYAKTMQTYAEQNLEKWTQYLNVPIPKIETCNSKSRWGCCYHNQNLIKLSAMTASLPENLMEMILVHELCHLRYHDHQQGFHTLLKQAIPDIEEREKLLKTITKTSIHRNLF